MLFRNKVDSTSRIVQEHHFSETAPRLYLHPLIPLPSLCWRHCRRRNYKLASFCEDTIATTSETKAVDGRLIQAAAVPAPPTYVRRFYDADIKPSALGVADGRSMVGRRRHRAPPLSKTIQRATMQFMCVRAASGGPCKFR